MSEVQLINEEDVIKAVLSMLESLPSDDDRLYVMNEVSKRFCECCGRKQPCLCWDDA